MHYLPAIIISIILSTTTAVTFRKNNKSLHLLGSALFLVIILINRYAKTITTLQIQLIP